MEVADAILGQLIGGLALLACVQICLFALWDGGHSKDFSEVQKKGCVLEFVVVENFSTQCGEHLSVGMSSSSFRMSVCWLKLSMSRNRSPQR
jgi:hypothetical protein